MVDDGAVDLLGDDGLLDLRPRARTTDPGQVMAEESERRRKSHAGSEPTVMQKGESAAPADGAAALCHLCGKREGRSICKSCERPVCAAHNWTIFGLCMECATPERLARWNAPAGVDDVNWLAPKGPG